MSVLNRPLGGLAAIVGAELILDTWEEVALGVGIFLSRPYKIPWATSKTFGQFYDEVYNVVGSVIRRIPRASFVSARSTARFSWRAGSLATRRVLIPAGGAILRGAGRAGGRLLPRVTPGLGYAMAAVDAAVLISDYASGDKDRIHTNFWVSMSDMAFAPPTSEYSLWRRVGMPAHQT